MPINVVILNKKSIKIDNSLQLPIVVETGRFNLLSASDRRVRRLFRNLPVAIVGQAASKYLYIEDAIPEFNVEELELPIGTVEAWGLKLLPDLSYLYICLMCQGDDLADPMASTVALYRAALGYNEPSLEWIKLIDHINLASHSDDGRVIVVLNAEGYSEFRFARSIDYGVTWEYFAAPAYWELNDIDTTVIKLSPSGSSLYVKLYTAEYEQDLEFISYDLGVTFVQLNPFETGLFIGCIPAVSGEFKYLYTHANLSFMNASLIEARYDIDDTMFYIQTPGYLSLQVPLKVSPDNKYLFAVVDNKLWRYELTEGPWVRLLEDYDFVYTQLLSPGPDMYVSFINFKVYGDAIVTILSASINGILDIRQSIDYGTTWIQSNPPDLSSLITPKELEVKTTADLYSAFTTYAMLDYNKRLYVRWAHSNEHL